MRRYTIYDYDRFSFSGWDAERWECESFGKGVLWFCTCSDQFNEISGGEVSSLCAVVVVIFLYFQT